MATLCAAGAASAKDVLGVACKSPPPAHCTARPARRCWATRAMRPIPKTGRKFWLDYPCDLKPGDKVVFILNIHGAGSIGQWQRHYFPAMDYKDKYKLVVATPTAATSRGRVAPAQPGVRVWVADADDAHLQNITDLVFDAFGKQNIKSFWLAGHSQGGATSHRIVCTDFFKDKVDGLLSLSGGRIGPRRDQPALRAAEGRRLAAGPAAAAPPAAATAAPLPACEFSHIFETGEHEIVSLPATSPLAEKFGCAARVEKTDVVDDQARLRLGLRAPGLPGVGHEGPAGQRRRSGSIPSARAAGWWPTWSGWTRATPRAWSRNVTEAIVKLMVAAPGGKAQP